MKRVLKWESWGISYEADPRHAELLIRQLGEAAHPLSTPGVRQHCQATQAEDLLTDALYVAEVALAGASAGKELEAGSPVAHELSRGCLYGPLPRGSTATRTTFVFGDGSSYVAHKRHARRFITLPVSHGRSWGDVVRRITVDAYTEEVLGGPRCGGRGGPHRGGRSGAGPGSR